MDIETLNTEAGRLHAEAMRLRRELVALPISCRRGDSRFAQISDLDARVIAIREEIARREDALGLGE